MQDRMTDLEIKLAHLEQAVNELSDVLYRQQGMLDRLVTGYERLQERVNSSAEGSATPDPTDEKPPHY
jgi:SlyX protein